MSFRELRWRLQHIAEEEIGANMRRERAREDIAATEAMNRAAD